MGQKLAWGENVSFLPFNNILNLKHKNNNNKKKPQQTNKQTKTSWHAGICSQWLKVILLDYMYLNDVYMLLKSLWDFTIVSVLGNRNYLQGELALHENI